MLSLLSCQICIFGEKGTYKDISLTITAIRNPCSLDRRMCSSRVVLPLPRKPDSKVTGNCLILGSVTLKSVRQGVSSPWGRFVVAIGGILEGFLGLLNTQSFANRN